MKVTLYIVFSLFFVLFSTAQDNYAMANAEAKLAEKLNDLRQKQPDLSLKAKSDSFKLELKRTLLNKDALTYPFTSLSSIGKVISDDENVRVFSWNYQLENETNVFNCVIAKYDKRRKKVYVSELSKGDYYKPSDTEILEKDNWYGALYYDIIDVKKGSKTYYTLLGYDPNNQFSHIKLMDVLYFAGKNPKLGYNLFKTKDGLKKRVFMEHAKKATMTLRFDKQRNKIIFDHLSPESPGLKDFREYYIPDMSYDAYVFNNNKWLLEEDVIAINKARPDKISVQVYDAKSDEIKTKEIKNKWQSPDGKNNPISGGKHKAVVPDDVDASKKGNKKPKKEKVKKKKEKEFKGTSYGNLGKKRRKRKR